MKRALLLILALVLGPVLGAQQQQTGRAIASAYNVSATSYTYPLLADTDTSVPGTTASTSGASTTVTGTGGPFAGLAVNDQVQFTACSEGIGMACVRVIRTWTNSNSITVDSNITLSSAGVLYRKTSAGSGANQGWVTVTGKKNKLFWWEIQAIAATSLEFQVQCAGTGPYATYNVVWPKPSGTVNLCDGGNGSFTGTGKCGVYVGEPWARCRIGLQVTGDVGTQSVTMGYESLTE